MVAEVTVTAAARSHSSPKAYTSTAAGTMVGMAANAVVAAAAETVVRTVASAETVVRTVAV